MISVLFEISSESSETNLIISTKYLKMFARLPEKPSKTYADITSPSFQDYCTSCTDTHKRRSGSFMDSDYTFIKFNSIFMIPYLNINLER